MRSVMVVGWVDSSAWRRSERLMVAVITPGASAFWMDEAETSEDGSGVASMSLAG